MLVYLTPLFELETFFLGKKFIVLTQYKMSSTYAGKKKISKAKKQGIVADF